MATHSSMVAWKNPVDRGAWQAIVHEVAKSWTWRSDWAQAEQYKLSKTWEHLNSPPFVLAVHQWSHAAFLEMAHPGGKTENTSSEFCISWWWWYQAMPGGVFLSSCHRQVRQARMLNTVPQSFLWLSFSSTYLFIPQILIECPLTFGTIMGNKTHMVSAPVELAFYLDPSGTKEVNKAEIVSIINKQMGYWGGE